MRRIAVLVALIVIVLVLIACRSKDNTDQATIDREAWTITIAAWQNEATVTAQDFYLRAGATPTYHAQQGEK